MHTYVPLRGTFIALQVCQDEWEVGYIMFSVVFQDNIIHIKERRKKIIPFLKEVK